MDNGSYKKTITMPEFSAWQRAEASGKLLSVSFELTARCNNNCIHCYINLPEKDEAALRTELTFEKLKDLIDEAASLGALWILFSGGEPLLRDDFPDIYTYAKKKGMLVSVFTNATLITDAHIELFKKYPPRKLEVTIYGISEAVHRKVTRNRLYQQTMSGLKRLKDAGIPVTLKAIAMKTNLSEFKEIFQYCQIHSAKPVRFDPFLNLRYDRDPQKNDRIISERLSAEEIIEIEQMDPKRMAAIESQCQKINQDTSNSDQPHRLLRCSAGISSCCISYDGIFKLCNALNKKTYTCDLNQISLAEAWNTYPAKLRARQAEDPVYKEKCSQCEIYSLCMACPANTDLETGKDAAFVPYFCEIAQKRFKAAKGKKGN